MNVIYFVHITFQYILNETYLNYQYSLNYDIFPSNTLFITSLIFFSNCNYLFPPTTERKTNERQYTLFRHVADTTPHIVANVHCI